MRPDSAPGLVPTRSPRLGMAALAFVIVSLAVLVLVPVLVGSRTSALRAEVDDVADPARALVTRIQFSMARELSALRGFVLTGDTAFLSRYRETVASQRDTHRELAPLADRLGPEVIREFATLRTLVEEWHERVEATELAPRTAVDAEVVPRAPAGGSLYEDALEAATALDAAIAAATRQRGDAVRAMERLNLTLTAVLVALSLLSALVVARAAGQIRILAESAEARRDQAEAALAQVRRSTEAKARLVRGVTHDVKNPLGAADGYAELLEMGLRGPITPEQATLVAGVRRSVHAALAIINEMLDLSRAESGELQVHHALTPLADVVRESVEDHRGAAEAAGHTLEVRVADGLPAVHTDAARVRQVLGNLLTNAIKYTPAPGHIRVGVASSRGERPGRWVAVRVADDGPGIAPGEEESIFLEFQRGSTATAAGHGLGLAMSLRIARLLGGDLTLESTPGAGACFALWLPGREDDDVKRHAAV